MECVLFERQRLGVREHVVDVAGHALVQETRAAFVEHRGVDVGDDDAATCADALRETYGEIAAAGCDVERLLAGPKPRLRDRETLPEPVQTARHRVVHEVVARSDGVEHAADAGFLLAPRHLLVAEVGDSVVAFAWFVGTHRAEV
jgi:hypothetical protein